MNTKTHHSKLLSLIVSIVMVSGNAFGFDDIMKKVYDEEQVPKDFYLDTPLPKPIDTENKEEKDEHTVAVSAHFETATGSLFPIKNLRTVTLNATDISGKPISSEMIKDDDKRFYLKVLGMDRTKKFTVSYETIHGRKGEKEGSLRRLGARSYIQWAGEVFFRDMVIEEVQIHADFFDEGGNKFPSNKIKSVKVKYKDFENNDKTISLVPSGFEGSFRAVIYDWHDKINEFKVTYKKRDEQKGSTSGKLRVSHLTEKRLGNVTFRGLSK